MMPDREKAGPARGAAPGARTRAPRGPFRPLASLVKHAPPMLLLDRVLSVTAETFEAEAVVRPDGVFCDGSKVDAWIGLEYMAQAVAAYAGADAAASGAPVRFGFLLGTRGYVSRVAAFRAGAKLRISVRKVLHDPGGLSVVECALREAGDPEPLATAQLTVYEVDDLAAYLVGQAR